MVLDMPVVISKNLYRRVVVSRFYIFMLCLSETVRVAFSNSSPCFIETFTTKVIATELVSVLRIMVAEPVYEGVEATGVRAKLLGAITLATRVTITAADAGRVTITFILCAQFA